MKIKQLLKQFAATTSALALLLALAPVQFAQAAFSGLNGRIVFTSLRDGQQELYSMRQDGSQIIRLNALGNYPDVSADGKKVVFTSNRDGNSEIYTMNIDGTGQTRLTNNSATDELSKWSPDGTKITFYTTRDGNQEVYTMNADGTNQQNITNHPSAQANPSWSPDGTKIAINDSRNSNHEIYTINPDGSNPTRLTTNASTDTRPSWSSDGTKVVFRSDRDGNPEIYSMNADGTNQTRLTTASTTDDYPVYSPDGTKIIWASSESGSSDVWSMDADGTNKFVLTQTTASDTQPSGQPVTVPPATINQKLVLDATKGSAVFNAPANHTDTYEQIDPASVLIIQQPTKGNISVNETTGEITYTSNKQASTGNLPSSLDKLFFKSVSAQSANQDSFTYQICSTVNNQLCTSVTVTVNLASASLADTGSRTANMLLAGSTAALFGFALLVIRKKLYV